MFGHGMYPKRLVKRVATEEIYHVVNYDTLLECLGAFLGCEPDEVLDFEGVWQWGDEHGERHEEPMQDAVTQIIKNEDVWGWIEDKRWVHIWFGDQCTPDRLLGALAHEFGHGCRPFHRDTFVEETKACKYGSVAMSAYSVMKDLMEVRDAEAGS